MSVGVVYVLFDGIEPIFLLGDVLRLHNQFPAAVADNDDLVVIGIVAVGMQQARAYDDFHFRFHQIHPVFW